MTFDTTTVVCDAYSEHGYAPPNAPSDFIRKLKKQMNLIPN